MKTAVSPQSAPPEIKFCSHCGAEMDSRIVGDKLRRACTQCRFIHFTDPKVGVGVFVQNEGNVLLIERAVLPQIGKWRVPAGYVDRGEDPKKTAVREVYYPGLLAHPQYELGQQQMSGGGGMVCFDLRGGCEAGYRLLQRLELIMLAVSLGGVHTLITHPASTISAVQSDAEKASSGVMPGLVRLSVGLESAADIIADLEQGLAVGD